MSILVILLFPLLLNPFPWYWIGGGIGWLEDRREVFFSEKAPGKLIIATL